MLFQVSRQFAHEGIIIRFAFVRLWVCWNSTLARILSRGISALSGQIYPRERERERGEDMQEMTCAGFKQFPWKQYKTEHRLTQMWWIHRSLQIFYLSVHHRLPIPQPGSIPHTPTRQLLHEPLPCATGRLWWSEPCPPTCRLPHGLPAPTTAWAADHVPASRSWSHARLQRSKHGFPWRHLPCSSSGSSSSIRSCRCATWAGVPNPGDWLRILIPCKRQTLTMQQGLVDIESSDSYIILCCVLLYIF